MLSQLKLDYLHHYTKDIIWNVSGFGNISHIKYFKNLYNLCQDKKIPFPINTIHGCFLCQYNGGRRSMTFAPKSDVKDHIDWFNTRGIGIKLTLSNSHITSKDFDDPYMRFLLDTINEHIGINNGVICMVDEFADFLHKEYPDLVVTSSHVKMEMETKLGETDTPEYYNNLFDRYDDIVMNTYRAFDDEFLDQIKYPERVEFIVNHACNCNCQMGCMHHKLIESWDMARDRALRANHDYRTDQEWQKLDKQITELNNKCTLEHNKNEVERILYQNINREEINWLANKGFTKMKIEGRDLTVFEMYVNLMKYIYNDESIMAQFYF